MDKLKKIFATVLNIPEPDVVVGLSPATTSSWDSLNALILITEIENAFGLKFQFEEAMGVKNFGEVVLLLVSKGVKLK
jgi:acyl carrier protein